MNNTKKLYAAKQVAEILGVTVQRVRELVKSGLIKAKKPMHLFVAEEDLEKFILTRRTKAGRPKKESGKNGNKSN